MLENMFLLPLTGFAGWCVFLEVDGLFLSKEINRKLLFDTAQWVSVGPKLNVKKLDKL